MANDDIRNWQLLADRFIWSDETALSKIPKGITDEEIQKYIYTYHGDNMSLEEIRQWRNTTVANDS
jgi:hypothetical protein